MKRAGAHAISLSPEPSTIRVRRHLELRITGFIAIMAERTASIYGLLQQPWVYTLVQSVLAPGADKIITRRITQLASQMPPGSLVLDVGCGPASWLWRARLRPVGLDLSQKYTTVFTRLGDSAVTASAAELPFA